MKKYRNEWKYCCISSVLESIGARLDAVLDRDIHGSEDGIYEIHSLYFDDFTDTCARENDAGISERFKYRIRYYGNRTDFIRLECKEKFNGRCHKESCELTMEQYEAIVSGNVGELFWRTQDELLKKFCVHCMTKGFLPKAIVDYERTAFVEDITNIRITLDKNISVSVDTERFLDGNYIKYPVLEKDRHVLEVKFDYILPKYVRDIVTNRNLVQSSFSKYFLGRKKLQSMGN